MFSMCVVNGDRISITAKVEGLIWWMRDQVEVDDGEEKVIGSHFFQFHVALLATIARHKAEIS